MTPKNGIVETEVFTENALNGKVPSMNEPRESRDWKQKCVEILKSKQALYTIGALCAIVALRLGLNWRIAHHKTSMMPQVSVVHPAYAPMDHILKLPANIEGIREASLYAHVDGYLKTLYVDEGDTVKKGELMADIEAPDIVQAYNRAKADYELQDETRKRYVQLLKGQVISQQEFDDLDAKYQEAKAALDNAAANLAYTHMTAPFDGRVARRFNYPGDLITKATQNESVNPVFIVVDESELRVAVDVPQVDVALVSLGSPVRIHVDAFANKIFRGRITRIDPLLDDTTKTQRVLIDIPNPQGLLHADMFANVDLILEHKDRALILPREALRGDQDAPFVYVIQNSVARRVPVKIGLNTINRVEIVSGVGEGQSVVLQGGSGLSDGMKVDAQPAPQSEATATEAAQ